MSHHYLWQAQKGSETNKIAIIGWCWVWLQRSYRPGQIILSEVCIILHIIHGNYSNSTAFSLHDYALGPVVWRAPSNNLGLNFNLGFSFLQKSNHQIVDKKNYTEFVFILSSLKSHFALSLEYLNPALYNPDLNIIIIVIIIIVIVTH